MIKLPFLVREEKTPGNVERLRPKLHWKSLLLKEQINKETTTYYFLKEPVWASRKLILLSWKSMNQMVKTILDYRQELKESIRTRWKKVTAMVIGNQQKVTQKKLPAKNTLFTLLILRYRRKRMQKQIPARENTRKGLRYQRNWKKNQLAQKSRVIPPKKLRKSR